MRQFSVQKNIRARVMGKVYLQADGQIICRHWTDKDLQFTDLMCSISPAVSIHRR